MTTACFDQNNGLLCQSSQRTAQNIQGPVCTQFYNKHLCGAHRISLLFNRPEVLSVYIERNQRLQSLQNGLFQIHAHIDNIFFYVF